MVGITINAGDGYVNADELKINYINAIGSADDMDVLITDTAGNPIWVGNDEVTGRRYFFANLNGQQVNGLKVARFDNCETLIIGVARKLD